MLTRWGRVYSAGMADYTPDEVEAITKKLIGADLEGLDLSGMELRGANLHRANLSGADLTAANLSNADLSNTILVGATYTTQTEWPEDFDPEAAGAVLVKEKN